MATTKTDSKPKKTGIPADKLEDAVEVIEKPEETVEPEAVEPIPAPKRVGHGYVDCNRLNIREGAGLDCPILMTVVKGTKLTVTDDLGEWLELAIAGTKAYCMAEYVKF